MKRKLLAMVCAVSMIASLGAATVYASDDVKATGEEKIALITMDSIDNISSTGISLRIYNLIFNSYTLIFIVSPLFVSIRFCINYTTAL